MPPDWHPFLSPVSELLLAQADLEVVDEAGLLRLEEMQVSLPLVLSEKVEGDQVSLAVGTPERIDTSVQPALHRITVRWTVE